ncbi:MAG: VOC family protein [Paracoccaceae bacterium]
MSRSPFVNLPVADLARATAFREAPGAARDPRVCSDAAAGLSLDGAIHVMPLPPEHSAGFSLRPVADPRAATAVLHCLARDSRGAVDDTLARAVAASGRTGPRLVQAHAIIHGRSVEDADGPVREPTGMETAAFADAPGASHV